MTDFAKPYRVKRIREAEKVTFLLCCKVEDHRGRKCHNLFYGGVNARHCGCAEATQHKMDLLAEDSRLLRRGLAAEKRAQRQAEEDSRKKRRARRQQAAGQRVRKPAAKKTTSPVKPARSARKASPKPAKKKRRTQRVNVVNTQTKAIPLIESPTTRRISF